MAEAVDWRAKYQQLATEFSGEAGPEEAIKALQAELAEVATDAALAAVIQHAAALVSSRADRLARERVEAVGLLERVTQRLEEISAYLGSARNR